MGRTLRLLEHGGDGGRVPDVVRDLVREGLFGGRRIRCPLCGWQPRKESRWVCTAACQMMWNTFDTAGRCPRCHKQWQHTACLACHRFSRHVDWYEQDAGPPN